jgi:uncharacterized protein YgiB involved in biofilm formation
MTQHLIQHQRKRSHSATLIRLLPAASLLVAACSPVNRQEQGVVYQDAKECSQMNPDASEQCQADYQDAVAAHPTTAPKYTSREECETDFGAERCEAAPERHAQGSFFMPMMMGYMAGQMFNRPMGGGQYAPGATMPPVQDSEERARNAGAGGANGGGRGSVATQPLYKSRDDQSTFRTATNEPVAKQSGAVMVNPSAARVQPSRVTRSGGFGTTAARMSSSAGS